MPRPLQQWQRQGLNRATAAGNQGQYLQAHPGVAMHQQRVAARQQGAQQPATFAPGQQPGFQAGGGGQPPAPQGSGATGSNKPSGGQQGQQQYQQMQQQQAGGPLAPGMGPGGGQSNMAGQQGGYNPPWGQPGSQQWNNYLQQQDQQQKAWMAANPGQGNPFMALQRLGNVGGAYNMGGPQNPSGLQANQMGNLQNMLGAQQANQGAGAANPGTQQQMATPQNMQALLQALMGAQR